MDAGESVSADDKSVSASRPETTKGAADEYAAEEDAERVKMGRGGRCGHQLLLPLPWALAKSPIH